MKPELKVPTFGDLFRLYPIIAEDQRKKTGGRPCVERTKSAVATVKKLLTYLKWDEDRLYTDMDRRTMDYLFSYMKDTLGKKPITAKSDVEQLRTLCARWTHFRYEEHGYKVTDVKLPSLYIPPTRYTERPIELRKKTLNWYNTIYDFDPDVWFFATMMLQFGMRNCDVRALTWDNFVLENDGWYLKYQPNKTKLTSGRIVHWPVEKKIWDKILHYKSQHSSCPFEWDNEADKPDVEIFTAPGYCQRNREQTELRLRKYMRLLGYTDSKCAYELRKLCASIIYKNFGQEAASSLLGDDIRTVLHYYADPSSVSKKIDITSLM